MDYSYVAEEGLYVSTASPLGAQECKTQGSHHQRANSPQPSRLSFKNDIDFGGQSQYGDQMLHHERSDPKAPSCLSFKSNQSKYDIIDFKDQKRSSDDMETISRKLLDLNYRQHQGADSLTPSCLSFKSDQSKYDIIDFKDQKKSSDQIQQQRANSLEPSCLSFKSDQSKYDIIDFKDQKKSSNQIHHQETDTPVPSGLSFKSDQSKYDIIDFRGQTQSLERVDTKTDQKPSDLSSQQRPTNRNADFKVRSRRTPPSPAPRPSIQRGSVQCSSRVSLPLQRLEAEINTLVNKELIYMERILNSDDLECFESQTEEEESLEGEDEEQRRKCREALQKTVLHSLRMMKMDGLADTLQSKLPIGFRPKLKSQLKKKFQCVFEGIAQAGNPTYLNQIYTELYITEGGAGEVNDEHEVIQIESSSRKQARLETTISGQDIFKTPTGRSEPIRTVMTKGVAGIGKTVLTQKFVLDWAENKTNEDIQFIFPFSFRELNILKDKHFSLVELVNLLFPGSKQAGICRSDDFNIVFIFDGLDECRLPLDFNNNHILNDVTESTSLDVLLTNLIWGMLLPSARLWITTRPAAVDQIPAECIDMVTDVRGFTDTQKEEYFNKRFKNEEQARRIISHVKKSRSLHIMCHIPVFSWITATVLDHVLRTRAGQELPKSLTEMYILFLVVQSKRKTVKHRKGSETDPHWNRKSKNMIERLGKLAFEQLLKSNLIFYEDDLRECDIDIREASMYSGVFTQIFKEEKGLFREKVFCFIHQSLQEFLAALYVHLTFVKSGVNLLAEQGQVSWWHKYWYKPNLYCLHQSALDKAIKSPNGRLDLFLRFLLGLSQQTNQRLLRGLQADCTSKSNQDTIQYVKKKISDNLSTEKNINLFHCLNELNDRSLMEEIQQSLRSGSLSTDQLSAAQWSALVFILLSSDEDLEVFDLKKYSASEEALLKLLPVIKASKKALLSNCNLSERSCAALSSVLSCRSSNLRELDMHNNDLFDSGVKALCVGLESPHCVLETLRLSGCLITKGGFASLDSALDSNPSHLRELDLSYNHPEDPAVKLLVDRVMDPHQKLGTLSVDPCGACWLKPGLKKYTCRLTLDRSTANRAIKVLEDCRKAMYVETNHTYPDHVNRFDYWPQLLCAEGLTGRCYWEVEWRGEVLVSVSYPTIRRAGDGNDVLFGQNAQSWTLICSDDGAFSVCHNGREASTSFSSVCPSSPSISNKVAVYLDHPAGTLSFYRVDSYTLSHLYTFNTTFTKPLHPGFGFWHTYGWFGSLVHLRSVIEEDV